MGRSEEKTGVFGDKYTEHYDDSGKLIGTSREKSGILSGDYTEHYDEKGRTIGTSREKSGVLTGEYVEHYDEKGRTIGTSREKSGVLTGEYVEHYDEKGRTIGTSREKTGPFGGKYTEHNITGSHESGNTRNKEIPVTTGDVGGVFVFAIILFVLAALAYAFQAWRAFAGKNETILKLSLEYFVPLVAMIIIAIIIARKGKGLKSTGLLEGAIVGLVMGGTSFFGLEMSMNIGDKLVEPLEKMAEDNFWMNIPVMVFPFFMYLVIFILYPVMGWLFRLIVSRLNDNGLKQTMNDINRGIIKPVCWITTVLFIVLFITVNLKDNTLGDMMMKMVFNFLFAGLATALMIKLSTRIACGKQQG